MKNESNLLIKITGYELSGELVLPKSKAERLVKKIVDERRKARTEIKGMLTFEFQKT
jgi:histone H3/H4